MDTRFLETFVTVVETGSIAAAARTLNLTPGGVAQRLHALEAAIGAPLFTRYGRTVRPTAAGIEIIERAKQLVRGVHDLKAAVSSDVLAGELRLGTISTALTEVVPEIVHSLTAGHPRVEIFILPGVSADLYQQVINGDLDAAVIVKPQFAIPKSCEWYELSMQPLVAIMPAALKTRDLHRTLSEQPFILYDAAQWGGQVVSRYLRKAGIAPRVRFRLDGLEGIVALVQRGLGVALVPNWRPAWPQDLAIQRLPLAEEATTRAVGLFWRRASPRIRLVQAFIKAAQKAPTGHAAAKSRMRRS